VQLGDALPGVSAALRAVAGSLRSIHVAVVAGTVVILVLVFGTTWLALVPLIAAIGWARVRLGDHTPAQSLAGALLGAAVAATVFTALR
jgi:membrane-associated phospholipid phosphatase